MSGPHTIWLASYPKSGNTWVRAILSPLTAEEDDGAGLDLNDMRGGPIPSVRAHMERFIGFATSDLTWEEVAALRPACDAALDRMLEAVRFRKIHDSLRTPDGSLIVPQEHTRGAVYVVRDPRDVVVSYAHHAGRPHEWAARALTRSDWAEESERRELTGQVRQHLGTWSDHVKGWLDQDLFPVLLVRYEDLSADPYAEARRIVEFAELEVTDDELTAAVEAASFDELRAQEERDGFGERPARDRAFFRRGQAGAWRDELAPELVARVERDHGEVMRRLGYDAPVRTSS